MTTPDEEKLAFLRKELEELRAKGFEKEVTDMEAKLSDPLRIGEVDAEIRELRHKQRERIFEFQIVKELDKVEAKQKKVEAPSERKLLIDEIFVIYKGGLLLSHQTRRLKPYSDKEIVAGMLTAVMNYIQDFGKDTFHQRSESIRRIDYGTYKILIETGEHICIAMVLSGDEPGNTPQMMRDTVGKIENRYRNFFENWDGTLQKIREIDGYVSELVDEIGSEGIVPAGKGTGKGEGKN